MPRDFSHVFFGTTDNKIQFQMVLTRKEHEMHAVVYPGGVYLEGAIDASGNVVVEAPHAVYARWVGGYRGKLSCEVVEGHQLLRLTGELTEATGGNPLSLALVDRYELGDGLKLVTARKHEESNRPSYCVDISYPQMSPASFPAAERFNRMVQQKIATNFDYETRTFESLSETQDSSDSAEDSSSLQCESFLEEHWQLVSGTSEFLSILFRSQSYGAGAAHSIESVSALNYDIKTARMIALSDLFLNESNYLRVISDYCLAALAARNIGSETWRSRGAGPDEKNYRAWVVVSEGIRIHFNEYQVASYAEGEQTVVVPVGVFQNLLKPESRRLFDRQVK